MEILLRHKSRRSAVTRAVMVSLVVHAIGAFLFWNYALIATLIGLSRIEFVEAPYNRAILIDFSKKLKYPGGYTGFRPPDKLLSLEDLKKEQVRRRKIEETRRLAREREMERQAEEEKLAKESNKPAEIAPATEEKYPGGFGKINTSPIKDQVERLYNAHKEGKLVFPEGKLRVGVSGRIKPDGSLADYKIIYPSGYPEIDRAAIAILDSVSESHALGPLADLTSLTIVLTLGERAEMSAVGFARTPEMAANIVNIANAAILYARFRKSDDQAAMVIINHLKVTRTGQRVHALVSVPRDTAAESLAKAMSESKSE
jgi:hypothetical protein